MNLQRHESSVLKEPQKRAENYSPTYSSDYKNPLECTLIVEQRYRKVHPKDPCYHPKNGNNKCCSCKQQLKLDQLISDIILYKQKKSQCSKLVKGERVKILSDMQWQFSLIERIQACEQITGISQKKNNNNKKYYYWQPIKEMKLAVMAGSSSRNEFQIITSA